MASVIALASVPLSAQAQSGIISGIRVEGNRRIESENVLAYLLISPGEQFDSQKLDQSLKTLFATGLFADVLMERDGNELVVKLVENPIVNQVLFEGNSSISNSKLEEEIEAAPRSIFTRTRVRKDVQRILELYRRSGRFSASVDPQYVELEQNRVDLIFDISEGPKTGIGVINFLGNTAFSDSRLRREIVTRQSRWWRVFGSNDNYDPDRIEYDQELLRQFYANNGYADFRFVSAVASLSPDQSKFYVTFTLDEGELYNFGKIDVLTGSDKLPRDVLMRSLRTKTSELYRTKSIEDSVDAIIFAAGSAGYAAIDVRPNVRINRDQKTVDVTYLVDEGPRVYIDRINIRGNTNTLDEVIRRELVVEEGDILSRVLLDISRNRLRALRFFEEVEITEQPGPTPDKRIVNVNVKEASTGQLSFSAGYSTVDQYLLNLDWSESNLGGTGRYFSTGIQLSSFRNSYTISFSEPRFIGRNISFGIDLYYVDSDYSRFTGYKNVFVGGNTSLTFPIGNRNWLGLNYSLTNSEVTINEDSGLLVDCRPEAFFRSTLCDQVGQNLTSEVGYSLRRDRRNDPIVPTRGYSITARQSYAGIGGNVHYLRNSVRASGYRSIVPGFIFSAHWDIGLIAPLAGDDVGISDRFFRGGHTFRGFAYSGIGPREVQYVTRTQPEFTTNDSGVMIPVLDENGQQRRVVLTNDSGEPVVDLVRGAALGGKTYFVGTLELSLPIPFIPEESGLEAGLFLEFGSVSGLDPVDASRSSSSEFTRWRVEDSGKVRVTTGLSIFWDTAIGPLQFDFSNILVKEDYDVIQTFNFTTRARY